MNIIGTMNKNTISYENFILWQPAENGLRIIRVYGNSPRLTLPEHIGDTPVTEIGPYCFSSSLPGYSGPLYYSRCLPDGTGSKEDGLLSTSLQEAESGRFPLSGNSIEEVRLPAQVHTLHNGAFYNCRQLKTLSVGPGLTGVGSDCFTNNRNFSRLLIRTDPHSRHGLRLLLERLSQDMTVIFLADSGREICSLYFPEYYEWLDEISPAHLFSRSINGAGFRMRKCFRDNRLDFEKYDECFESALREESDETLCRICFCRLSSPTDLKDRFRDAYEEALRERLKAALTFTIRQRDSGTLSWLCRTFSPDRTLLRSARELCLDRDWSEGTSLLMEISAAANIRKRFDFD